MTYDSERVKAGRRPITVVEIDLDYCANTYGTSPCTAAVGVTGSQKCFNCFATCQDKPNFSKTTKTYTFTELNALLPLGQNVFPCIRSVDIAPTQLKPSGFAVSAAVTVVLDDFPHHDRGIDPYVGGRSYDPNTQGTFFGKLKARNPYVVNRVMRVKTGYIDDGRTIVSLTRTYFIDRIEGPDNNGAVRIIGKDILRFSEIEQSMCPRPPTASLSALIGSGPAVFVGTPAGSGANYPTAGYLSIGDEIIEYTRSGDTFTTVNRGAFYITGSNHPAGAAIQECFPYGTNTKLVSKIKSLLVDYAGIDASYIDYAAWEAECDAYINSVAADGLVSEPESVKTLIEELLDTFGCALWWDELDAKIKFKVLAATAPATVTLNEAQHILEGSMTVKMLEKERISRIQINYATLKSTTTLASELKPEISNCTKALLTIDSTSEGGNEYGGKAQKSIVTRWMSDVVTPTSVQDIENRYLSRYTQVPREVTFKLDAKDATLRTGDLVNIQSRLLQSPDGSSSPIKFLVTEFRETNVGSQYQYTALEMGS